MKGSIKIKIIVPSVLVAVLTVLFFLPPVSAPAPPLNSILSPIITIPSPSPLSGTTVGNDMTFTQGSAGVNITIARGILNDVEVSIPSAFNTQLNNLLNNRYKFSLKFNFTNPFAFNVTLGVKLSINSTSGITTNSTGYTTGDGVQNDYSDAVASGFNVTIIKELNNSASITIKKSFASGFNSVNIDPAISLGTTTSDPFQYNYFQRRIAYVNDTWFIFYTSSAGNIDYVASFDGITFSAAQTAVTGVTAPAFDVDYNTTNISIAYNPTGASIRTFALQGLTLASGNTSTGSPTPAVNGQVTHTSFSNGNSVYGYAAGGTNSGHFIVNFTAGVFGATGQDLNSTYANSGGAPAVNKLNDTAASVCYLNRFGTNSFTFYLHCGIYSSATNVLANVQTYASDKEYNSTMGTWWSEKTGEMLVGYVNSTGTLSFKRRNNDSTITQASQFDSRALYPTQDGSNWQGRNTTCGFNNQTLTLVCGYVNGTGLYIGNISLDFKNSTGWGLAISRVGNLTNVVSSLYNATNGLFGFAWQEQTGIFFASINASQPLGSAPPVNNAPIFNYTSNTTYQGTTQITPASLPVITFASGLNISLAYNATGQTNPIDTFVFQINGTNFTSKGNPINSGTWHNANIRIINTSIGGPFFINFTSLPVGTYVGFAWVNDTSNLQNQSTNFTITVNRLAPTQTFTPTTQSITYNATINEACSSNSNDTSTQVSNLYRSGILISTPRSNFVNNGGSITYSCDTLQTANYSQVSGNSTLTVNTGTPNVGAFFQNLGITNNNATTSVYNTTIYFNGNTTTQTTGQTVAPVFTLFHNDTTTEYNDGSGQNVTNNIVLGNGTWVFSYRTPGNGNWSASQAVMYAVILKATPVLSTFINNLSTNQTITYFPSGTYLSANTTTTGVGPPTLTFYRNNTSLGTGTSVISNIGVGYGTHCLIYNTTGSQNYTSSQNNTLCLTVNSNSTGTITGSNLNGSYANGVQGIALYVNASLFDNVTVELQNQTGTFNFTVPFNGANGNYTIGLNSSHLGGNMTVGASRINLTRLIFGNAPATGPTNYTQSTNASGLGFDFGLSVLDNSTVVPATQTNNTGATFSFSARYDQSDNAQAILTACHVEVFAANFSASYIPASNRHLAIVSAERATGTYSYRFICDANSSYQMRVATGSLVVTSGSGQSGGGSAPSGGGAGGTNPALVVITNKTLTITPDTYIITAAQGGKLVSRDYSIYNTLSEKVFISAEFTGPYASWARSVQGVPIEPGRTRNYQVNVTIPDGLSDGNYDIGIVFRDASSGISTASTIEVQVNLLYYITDFLVRVVTKLLSPLLIPIVAAAPLQQLAGLPTADAGGQTLSIPFAYLGITITAFSLMFWALATRTRIFRNKPAWPAVLSLIMALVVLVVVP